MAAKAFSDSLAYIAHNRRIAELALPKCARMAREVPIFAIAQIRNSHR
jgi:hypothetical protein